MNGFRVLDCRVLDYRYGVHNVRKSVLLYFFIFLIFFRLFKNKDSRSRPDHLLFAEVITMPISQCNELYLNYNRMANTILLQYGISENQYCAYDQHERSDSCRGDSGA